MHLGKRVYSLLMFLAVSCLGGLLFAGLGVPAMSMVTGTGKDVATGLSDLPDELQVPPEAERSRLLNADGTPLATFYNQNRVVVSLDNIAPIMRKAQVAIEDHRFYEHGAIDMTGTLRALVSTSQGVTQGGSSITQQLVRLLLIQAADDANDDDLRAKATENTVARKIRELRYAIGLEQKFSKDDILERYLNISYYGDGAYGVEAAAKHYFGVSAKDLDLAQAAMLAGLVRNPVLTNPVKYPQVALERRNNVIDRMVELGTVTQAEGAAAKLVGFDQSKVTDNTLGCKSAEFPFICKYAEKVLVESSSSPLGSTNDERKARLYNGGLTITTTVNPKTQRQTEKVIAGYLDARDPAISVISMIEPKSGKIVAMAQSRPKMGDNREKGETYFNYAVPYSMGGAEGFQGGSTFKMFVAAAALNGGMGAYGKYKAQSAMDFTGQTYRSCEGDFPSQKWRVVGGSGGAAINMFQGVTGSVNTYFAQLEQGAGICESVTMATKLGLQMGKPTDEHPDIMSYDSIPSFTLGAVEIAPLSLVSAYATVANRGVHCDPIILASIKTKQGVDIPVPSANCRRVLDEDVADALNQIFQGPINSGTARPAKIPGLEMAGKTGTVSDNKAIWTMGYTPELAAGAVISWDSDPNPANAEFWAPRKKSELYLKGAYMKYSKHYLTARSGAEAGGQLLRPAFEAAIKTIKGFDKNATFAPAPAAVLRGEMVDVPSCSGKDADACAKALRKAGFSSYVDKVDADEPKGSIVGLNPSGSAAKYSSIGIQVSNGPKAGSQAWCGFSENVNKPECVQYLPPPTCEAGYVLVPTPPPGVCVAQPGWPGQPGDQGQGQGQGQGRGDGNG